MSLSCQCPNPTAIGNIPAQTCPENFNQIQKFAIQRSGYTFDGTTGKDITLLADWQTVTSATDDTHAVVTPCVYARKFLMFLFFCSVVLVGVFTKFCKFV